MAYYAFLDENNIVTEVIPGKDEGEDGVDWEKWYGDFKNQVCKRTSYNTQANKHTGGKEPFRKNFGRVGFFYDQDKDAFIPPKRFPSWSLDENTFTWKAPVQRPDAENFYRWDEDTLSWILVPKE